MDGSAAATCRGNTFAGRVGASLCAAAGVPELVAHSLPEYERKALALARDPELLQALRLRLASTRLSCPLFRTGDTTRHIEMAFNAMLDRQRAGLPPESFYVQPIQPQQKCDRG